MKYEMYNTLIDNMPEHPGVLGRKKYFNAAVMVPFVVQDDEYYVLFQKRAAAIRQSGEICFPGGKFDRNIDKSYRETAIRETSEELGLDRQKIHIDASFDSLVAAMGAIVDVFIGRLDIAHIDECEPNKEEVDQIFLLPFSYFTTHRPEAYRVHLEIHPHYFDETGKKVTTFPAQALGLPEKYWKSWGGASHTVYVYNTDFGAIWGITAEILYALVQMVA